MWRGTASLRRLRNLIAALPADSATAAAINPDGAAWSLGRQLAAASVDLAQQTNHLLGALLTAWSSRGTSNPISPPRPIPRPGVAGPEVTRGAGMRALVTTLGARRRPES